MLFESLRLIILLIIPARRAPGADRYDLWRVSPMAVFISVFEVMERG
jgi:hypothetical protein